MGTSESHPDNVSTRLYKIVLNLKICCFLYYFSYQQKSGIRFWTLLIQTSLREKCPNTEFLLVRIFPYSDWIRRDTPNLSVFSPNEGKKGTEKTLYLDTFYAVRFISAILRSPEKCDSLPDKCIKFVQCLSGAKLFLESLQSLQTFW